MLITEIQRFSIHDGPGCRTTVFFKGCPLRCLWCHNPETQDFNPEEQFFEAKCIHCGQCAQGCYTGARRTVGTHYSVAELMEQLLQDRQMYTLSGGGVTFSGGEPFAQSHELQKILHLCKDAGIHTAVETAACVAYENIKKCLPYIDLIYCDIKALDDTLHKKGTGVSNALILQNIRAMALEAPNLILRTPVIPGFNDTQEEIAAICDFAASLPGERKLELLKYHSMGVSKYPTLGRKYALSVKADPARFAQLKSYVRERSLLYEPD